MRPTPTFDPPRLPDGFTTPDPTPPWGRFEHSLAVLAVIGALVLTYVWASLTMHDSAARTYQCSVGNQRPFVCAESPRPTD